MIDDADADAPARDAGSALAALEEAIARSELQVALLCSVVAMRQAKGRDHRRLERLATGTRRRLAELRAERARLLAGGGPPPAGRDREPGAAGPG
jgi:multidrug resistance efflux pump